MNLEVFIVCAKEAKEHIRLARKVGPQHQLEPRLGLQRGRCGKFVHVAFHVKRKPRPSKANRLVGALAAINGRYLLRLIQVLPPNA